MTHQFPEQLVSHHPDVDFTDLRLYGLFRGAPDARESFDYPTPPTPNPDCHCTALYRGYVAELVLDAEGYLTVVGFRYLRDPEFDDDGNAIPDQEFWRVEPVSDRLDGDFWLEFRPHFLGDQTLVPFRDGRLVWDRSQWEHRGLV
jgi:hypothetical protein